MHNWEPVECEDPYIMIARAIKLLYEHPEPTLEEYRTMRFLATGIDYEELNL